jgi:hypothetical protein
VQARHADRHVAPAASTSGGDSHHSPHLGLAQPAATVNRQGGDEDVASVASHRGATKLWRLRPRHGPRRRGYCCLTRLVLRRNSRTASATPGRPGHRPRRVRSPPPRGAHGRHHRHNRVRRRPSAPRPPRWQRDDGGRVHARTISAAGSTPARGGRCPVPTASITNNRPSRDASRLSAPSRSDDHAKPQPCGDIVDAPERIRTSADHTVHTALNLGDLVRSVRIPLARAVSVLVSGLSFAQFGPQIGPPPWRAPALRCWSTSWRARALLHVVA